MLINEKKYRVKSPEAISLETTTAHYFLFYYKTLEDILLHDSRQKTVDVDLAITAKVLEDKEKVRQYVR